MAEEKPPSEVGREGGEEEEAAAGGSSGGEKAAEAGLTPWEQHASVIILPRFDYAAPSALLQRPHSGFLITCPIKREKSATKEAISLLKEYIGSRDSNNFSRLESCGTVSLAKRRKVLVGTDAQSFDNAEGLEDNHVLTSDNVAKLGCLLPSKTGEDAENCLSLSLIKLTRSGLLLFTFPSDSVGSVVDIYSKIFNSLQNGELRPPHWCNRIFPIQQTCIFTQKDVQVIVSKLIQEYLGNQPGNFDKSFKFAVGYNRRGFDEPEMKTHKSSGKDSEEPTLLDRDTCFKVVAGAVKAVAKNSVVDLKCPEVAVLVEVLPVSGIPHGSLVVAVSVLPLEFVTTKPRLCIKSLVADTKVTKRRV